MPVVTKTRQWIVILGLSALILLSIIGLFLTRNSSTPIAQSSSRRTPLVDERPVQLARMMANLVSSREELRFAQESLRLADHSVDLAFADAIREATLQSGPSSPESKELTARVRRAEAQVKSDQDMIDEVKKESAAGRGSAEEFQQQLDLLQAQLELDKDELEDARNDLLRSGADPLSRVQRQFARYQSRQQTDAARAQNFNPADATGPGDSLIAQVRTWWAQRGKIVQLRQARDETLQKHEELQKKHDSQEQASQAGPAQVSEPASPGVSQDKALIESLRRLSDRQKNLSDLDKRIQDHQDLADVYGNWMALISARQQATTHAVLRSLLFILLIVFAVYLADRGVDQFFAHVISDRRRLLTLQVVVHFVLQAIGLLLIALVVFGMPRQISTILGLAGAGLTVALKDFIVAFFGWFVLMGRNGIRVGDWVEINGVAGEVVEIGLLRTVLLETGNWADTGHPTGRKVAFVNSYAVEGHYFNFSTSGQWLWDELQVLVPTDQNPYPVVEAIQKLVTTATEANARTAEQEWQRATGREGANSVSSAPAIDLRPTPLGVEVHVRYITRANERHATRAMLYEQIVTLLHRQASEASSATPVKAGS